MSATFAFKKGQAKRAVVTEAPVALPVAAAVVPPSSKRAKVSDTVGTSATIVAAPASAIPIFPTLAALTSDDLPALSSRSGVLHSGVLNFVERVVQRHVTAAISACARGNASDRATIEAAQSAAAAFVTSAREIVAAHGAIPEGANPKNVENRARMEELKKQINT